MSAYRAGIRGRLMHESVGYSPATDAAWTAANSELQSALTLAVRSFPLTFTAERAAQLLEAATVYGRKALSKYAGMFSGVDATGLQRAINVADDESKKWRSRIPFFGTPYVYGKGANKEWSEVNAQVIRVYVEAAGIIGQRMVIEEARQELAQNLNPLSTDNIVKAVAIAGAALVVTAFLQRK